MQTENTSNIMRLHNACQEYHAQRAQHAKLKETIQACLSNQLNTHEVIRNQLKLFRESSEKLSALKHNYLHYNEMVYSFYEVSNMLKSNNIPHDIDPIQLTITLK